MYKENFVDNVRKARKSANLTQEEVAEKLNTSRSNITKYELGTLEPNIETIGMLAELYGVSTDWLFGILKTSNIDYINKSNNKYSITQNNNNGNNFFM